MQTAIKRILSLCALLTLATPCPCSRLASRPTPDNYVVFIQVVGQSGEVGFGTGVVVSKNGHVVTAAHVVREAERLLARYTIIRNRQFDLKILEISPENDLVLLEPRSFKEISGFTPPLFLFLDEGDTYQKPAFLITTADLPLVPTNLARCVSVTSATGDTVFVVPGEVSFERAGTLFFETQETLVSGMSGSPAFAFSSRGHGIVGLLQWGTVITVVTLRSPRQDVAIAASRFGLIPSRQVVAFIRNHPAIDVSEQELTGENTLQGVAN